MIKLIALDLDGTLLDEQKRLPEGFENAVSLLLEHGVRVVIASGRQYFNLLTLFPSFSEKLIFLCENGAIGFDGKTLIFAHEIPREKLRNAYLAVNTIPTATALLCGAESAYLPEHPAVAVEENARLYYQRRRYCKNPFEESGSDRLLKMAVFDQEDAAANCAALRTRFQRDFQIALAGKNWLDLMMPGVNKGLSIRNLQEYLDISPSECMAFGDYMNDYEMLQSVSWSYAMANGLPELQATARFIAPSNQEDGVMTVLRQHFSYLR